MLVKEQPRPFSESCDKLTNFWQDKKILVSEMEKTVDGYVDKEGKWVNGIVQTFKDLKRELRKEAVDLIERNRKYDE